MPKNKNKAKKSKTHSSDNSKSTPETPVEVVATPVVATPVVAAPVVAQVQKGGKAKKVTKKSAKVVPKQVVEPVVEAVNDDVTETQVATEVATDTATEVVSQTGSGKRVRSFKVRLPGTETFEGRFTGLTPYQAANKALSKYYRETNKPKKQITFTIRESTRGSKRSLYTYNGKREKLKIPVQYSINDGRIITKNYKNRLTKIKKAELASLQV